MVNVNIELVALAKDLYNEGYQCGISDDAWFCYWAAAMDKVANGCKYTDDLVVEIKDELTSPLITNAKL